jgi:C4-dicarboxylate transporter, DctQ subunit
MLERVDRALERIERALFFVAIAALAAMAAIVVVDVALRWVRPGTLPWLGEIPIFLNIGLVFLSMPYLLRKQRHIRFSLAFEHLPAAARRGLGFVLTLAMLGLFAVLLWAGYTLAARSYALGNVSYTVHFLPLFVPQALVPLGALLLALEAAVQLVKQPGADAR